MDDQVEVDPMLSTESSFDFDGGFDQEEFQEEVDWDDSSEGSFGSAAAVEAERVAPWDYFDESAFTKALVIALVALIVEGGFSAWTWWKQRKLRPKKVKLEHRLSRLKLAVSRLSIVTNLKLCILRYPFVVFSFLTSFNRVLFPMMFLGFP